MNEILAAAAALIESGDRGVMATAIEGDDRGTSVVLAASGTLVAGSSPPAVVATAASSVLVRGSPEAVEADDGVTWFVEPLLPAPRLVVLGAIAATDALVPMAAAAGFAVHVIDTRDWLADEKRFPDAASVLCGAPLEMLREVGIDSATSVVSFLHEARLEDDVLVEALQSPARYVGSMGSRKSTAAKRRRLESSDLGAAELERLRAPIGIQIGSRTPQEMAVSVLAEIVAVGHGRD